MNTASPVPKRHSGPGESSPGNLDARSGKNGRLAAAIGLSIAVFSMISCQARTPGSVEGEIGQKTKEITIGGKDLVNPVADDLESQGRGGEHFRHHCQFCHGLDGHNTGVPFAGKMSPPVADLGSDAVQAYRDGQLKWIIENGIRFSGMPGWKDILTDDEMWAIVRYIRHLPAQGSLGAPKIFEESAHEHESTKGAEHHH